MQLHQKLTVQWLPQHLNLGMNFCSLKPSVKVWRKKWKAHCRECFHRDGYWSCYDWTSSLSRSMNMGFLLLAFNQISNNCGMLHCTSGGQFKIPIVIRGPGGVGRQLGAEHSQRLESYFQSIPGIQMVACSTPYTAKGLMKTATRSDNPVILFEHILLYNLKERIPDEEYVCNLEEVEMVRQGEHVTILTYSRMRYHVMQAAKPL